MDSMSTNIQLSSDNISDCHSQFYNQFGENGPWNEHPEFSRTDWQKEVVDGSTNLGYWDYVLSCLEQKGVDSARKVFPELSITVVAELTEANCHNEARIFICLVLQDKELLIQYIDIATRSDEEGCLSVEDLRLRNELDFSALYEQLRLTFTNGEDVIAAL